MPRIYASETRVSLDGNLTETSKKVVPFRRNRSDGNTGKRNVSANGNVITVMFPQRFYVFTLSFHLRILEISSCDMSSM